MSNLLKDTLKETCYTLKYRGKKPKLAPIQQDIKKLFGIDILADDAIDELDKCESRDGTYYAMFYLTKPLRPHNTLDSLLDCVPRVRIEFTQSTAKEVDVDINLIIRSGVDRDCVRLWGGTCSDGVLLQDRTRCIEELLV